MFQGYAPQESTGDWATYIMYDSDFHTTFSVVIVQNDLDYLSDLYYNIYSIYSSRQLNVKELINQLFIYDYRYSLEKRGIDILQTKFFKEHGQVKKVLLLL